MTTDQKTVLILKRKSQILAKILKIANGKRVGSENIHTLLNDKREINKLLKPI
jgi:hypothetical protein